ncbi:MAG: hypothetical protein H6Q69_3183 [Firmicutes bacterium]|nr:hypothetical protein [Bacillota bacterium]
MGKEGAEILDILSKYGPLLITIIVGLWARYKFHQQQSFNIKLQEQKAELDKDIKYYEQRLTLLTEHVKFEHGKRNEDFKIWTIKRHEAYADIHEKLLKLYLLLTKLQFFLWGPTEIDIIVSELDIISITEKFGIDNNASSQIAALWRTDENQAKEKLELLLQKDRESKINEVAGIINDKTFQWSLYLPIEMRDILLDLYIKGISNLFNIKDELWRNNETEMNAKLKEAIEKCKIAMNKMVADLSGEIDKIT